MIEAVKSPEVMEDERFKAVLLRDIPYFHKLYAKYHDPQYLEIAKNLGIAVSNINRKLHRA